MMRAMLYVQWKATRWLLVPLVLLAYAAPVIGVSAARQFAIELGRTQPNEMLSLLQDWLPVYPFLAVLTGFMIALAVWEWDHRLGHVYALSLPLSRARYVLLRVGAGALLLLVPALAFWAGAFTAVATTPIPETLHAYPFSFGFRFLLACLVAYAASCALAAGTMRTVLIFVLGMLVLLVGGSLIVEFVRDATHVRTLPTPFQLLYMALVRWPGPFHVFGGNWMLIDV